MDISVRLRSSYGSELEGIMQVRFPKWDFSNKAAHWAPNHEFAQKQNAISLIPAYTLSDEDDAEGAAAARRA